MDKKLSGDRARTSPNETDGNKKGQQDVAKAHKQADKDIASDAELSAHSPNDDLDEGESARLGEGENGLV